MTSSPNDERNSPIDMNPQFIPQRLRISGRGVLSRRLDSNTRGRFP